MKKTLSMLLLLTAAAKFAMAQGDVASGSVRDADGKPLHFVFVGDVANRNAVFTDTLGNFSIQIKPGSKLVFELDGYKDTVVNNINTNTGLLVVLKPSGVAADPGTLSTKVEVERSTEITSITQGGEIAPGHQKGDLRGSQYKFEVFVHGYLINGSDELVYKPNYMLDYDKVGGGLLLTADKKKIVNVISDQVKSFTLYSMSDQRYDFTKVPAIDNSHFVQVVAAGPKYKIYKLTKTTFVKSDYVNNGVVSHGHDYDEYVDDDTYFIEADGGQPQKFSPKKRALKEVFAKDADKLGKFMSENSGSINDEYLGKLGAFMNK
ncbi:MAG: carboxypeptidase regulatory-like domain-containing protein [Bacteroidetes bacterium]|nr:carboxypeptidase regulatory-like domain-containing protein [Bacteroidota bacterium]